jgi:hypothetical protein
MKVCWTQLGKLCNENALNHADKNALTLRSGIIQGAFIRTHSFSIEITLIKWCFIYLRSYQKKRRNSLDKTKMYGDWCEKRLMLVEKAIALRFCGTDYVARKCYHYEIDSSLFCWLFCFRKIMAVLESLFDV